jgi:hypothetical protein
MASERKRSLEKLQLPFTASLDDVKHAYRKMALKFHPDKNRQSDAAAKFAEIHEAYEYLTRHSDNGLDFDEDVCFAETNGGFAETEGGFAEGLDYNDLVSDYLQQTFGNDILYKTLLKVVLKKLVTSKTALDWLRRLNVAMLERIHAYLVQHGEVFHLPAEFLDGLGTIIREKMPKSDNTYVLTPTIDDMFACNLFRLTVAGTNYAVPLWHHEMVFDDPNGEPIYVECHPVLPADVCIDSYNTIHVYTAKSVAEIWKCGGIDFELGTQKFSVAKEKITLSDNQCVVLRRVGIPLINTRDAMDVSRRGDIHVHILLSQ